MDKRIVNATWPLVVGREVSSVVFGFASSRRRGGGSAGETLRRAAERLLRLALFYLGLRVALRGRAATRPAVFVVAAALQAVLRPIADDVSLFLCLRAASAYLTRVGVSQHLSAVGVFLLHYLHNGLMVTKADWVSPAYVKLWLQCMPHYATVADYLGDFASASTATAEYSPAETAGDRLARLPGRMLQTLRVQLPAVAGVYTIPKVVFYRKTLREVRSGAGVLGVVAALLIKIARSAVVLSCLPYSLTEFPAVSARVRAALGCRKPALRQPLLHVACASALSTAVFLAEPRGRLELMVVYTYWRVVEALMRAWRAGGGPVEAVDKQQQQQQQQSNAGTSACLVGAMGALVQH